MKTALYGKDYSLLEELLKERGVEIVSMDHPSPDLIISYGGDGAMLGAELLRPGILKFPIRDRETAPLCGRHSLEKQLDLLLEGRLKKSILPKLEGKFPGYTGYAVNDVFLHNKNTTSALRYEVMIDGEIYAREVVGDGVGVSTVHGSTAYYRSITHGTFRVGMGVAFSNSTELMNHLVLREDSVVKVRILRGSAELVVDNIKAPTPLKEGESVTINMSEKKAVMLALDLFMCPECRKLRREERRSGYENIPF